MKPSLCNCLHYPVTSNSFGSNIALSTMFSNTLNLCYGMKDQVSHIYKNTGKIAVLNRMVASNPQIQSALNISVNVIWILQLTN